MCEQGRHPEGSYVKSAHWSELALLVELVSKLSLWHHGSVRLTLDISRQPGQGAVLMLTVTGCEGYMNGRI